MSPMHPACRMRQRRHARSHGIWGEIAGSFRWILASKNWLPTKISFINNNTHWLIEWFSLIIYPGKKISRLLFGCQMSCFPEKRHVQQTSQFLGQCVNQGWTPSTQYQCQPLPLQRENYSSTSDTLIAVMGPPRFQNTQKKALGIPGFIVIGWDEVVTNLKRSQLDFSRKVGCFLP